MNTMAFPDKRKFDSCSFFQYPKALLVCEKYRKGLKPLDRDIYVTLRDLASLSALNHEYYTDDNGELYVLSARESIALQHDVSVDSISRSFERLTQVGLIKEKRQGQGYPNRIYVQLDLDEISREDFLAWAKLRVHYDMDRHEREIDHQNPQKPISRNGLSEQNPQKPISEFRKNPELDSAKTKTIYTHGIETQNRDLCIPDTSVSDKNTDTNQVTPDTIPTVSRVKQHLSTRYGDTKQDAEPSAEKPVKVKQVAPCMELYAYYKKLLEDRVAISLKGKGNTEDLSYCNKFIDTYGMEDAKELLSRAIGNETYKEHMKWMKTNDIYKLRHLYQQATSVG